MEARWYAKNTGCGGQALIIDEKTGEDIAVSYREENAPLLAAAPELLDFAIQYLYSEHGECVPRHEAAPFTAGQLRDMARAAIAAAEER